MIDELAVLGDWENGGMGEWGNLGGWAELGEWAELANYGLGNWRIW